MLISSAGVFFPPALRLCCVWKYIHLNSGSFRRSTQKRLLPSFQNLFSPSVINNPPAFAVTWCSQRRHYAAITSSGCRQARCVMAEMELLLLHKSDLVRRNSTPPHSFNCEDHFVIFWYSWKFSRSGFHSSAAAGAPWIKLPSSRVTAGPTELQRLEMLN